MGSPDPDDQPTRRIRKVDWTAVLAYMERSPAGTPFMIGRMHRSIATQINRGKYAYIDPNVYEAWTANREGEVSEIWMRKKT
jgi:hypothetical protein